MDGRHQTKNRRERHCCSEDGVKCDAELHFLECLVIFLSAGGCVIVIRLMVMEVCWIDK